MLVSHLPQLVMLALWAPSSLQVQVESFLTVEPSVQPPAPQGVTGAAEAARGPALAPPRPAARRAQGQALARADPREPEGAGADDLRSCFEDLRERWQCAQLERRRELAQGALPGGDAGASPSAAQEFRREFEELADMGSGEASLWLAEQFRAARGLSASEPLDRVGRLCLREIYSRLVTEHHADQDLLVPCFFQLLEHERDLEAASIDALLEELTRLSTRPEVAGSALLLSGRRTSPRDCPDSRAQEQACRLFEQVMRRFPATDAARKAEDALWQIKNLAIGREAPLFRALDSAGNEIVLSDYRGQVAVLRFWASMDPGSADALEQAEYYSQKYWDRRFIWIGVNLDPEREQFLRRLEEARPGPSQRDLNAWEGGKNRPTCVSWHTARESSTFVLDSKGIVRGVDLEGDALTTLVEVLLVEQGHAPPERPDRGEEH